MSDHTTINAYAISERRFDGGAWLTLIVALAFLCLTLWNTSAILALPGDGWQISYGDADALNPSWPLWNFIGHWHTPLHANDIILAIDGMEIEKQQPLSRWEPPADWREGGVVRYTVLRGDLTLDIDVTLYRLGTHGILSGFWRTMQESPAEWGWLFVSLVVFFLRPANPAARLLLIIGVTHSSVTKLAWAGTTISANFAPPILHILRFWIVSFWAPFFWPSVILLTLSFPVPIYPLTRYPRAVPFLLYSLAVGMTLIVLITRNISLATWGLVTEGVVMFLVFGAAAYNIIRHSKDRIARAQVLWVVFGFMVSMGIGFPVYLLNIHEGIKPGQVEEIISFILPFTTLFLPVSLGIAITKYHLFDIQVIIRRTLVYTLLTGMLSGVYFGGVALLQGILTADGGPPTAGELAVSGQAMYSSQPSAVVIVVTTLTIAALFNPLRRRLQETIDRRFYRQKYDAEKALADFAAVARSETNLPALTHSLVSVVQDTVQPEEVKLWLKP